MDQVILMGVASIDPVVAAVFADGTPCDFSSAAVDDSVINVLVEQTNISATQRLLDGSDIAPYF
jgi:hypothetical protein